MKFIVVLAFVASCAATDSVRDGECSEGATKVDGVCRCGGAPTASECTTSEDEDRYCSFYTCVTRLPWQGVITATDGLLFSRGTTPVPVPVDNGWTTGYIPTLFQRNLATSTIAPLMYGSHLVVDGSDYVVEAVKGLLTPSYIVTCENGDCSSPHVVIDDDTPSQLLTAYDGRVFFLNSTTSEIQSCPALGGCPAPETLATVDSLFAFAASSTGVYMHDGSTLWAIPPGGPQTAIMSGTELWVTLRLHGSLLYVRTETEIATCPATVSPCTKTVVTKGTSIRDIHVDDKHLYWSDRGELRRCPVHDCSIAEPIAECWEPLVGTTEFLYCRGTDDTLLRIAKE